MEWMLQVVDEIDDAFCAARHGLFGVHVELSEFLLSVAAAVRLRTPALRARP